MGHQLNFHATLPDVARLEEIVRAIEPVVVLHMADGPLGSPDSFRPSIRSGGGHDAQYAAWIVLDHRQRRRSKRNEQ